MAELDPSELATVLDAAQRYLDGADWDAAYNLLSPLSEAGTVTGEQLGQLNFQLGDACTGLGSLDAAIGYYENALPHQSGITSTKARSSVCPMCGTCRRRCSTTRRGRTRGTR